MRIQRNKKTGEYRVDSGDGNFAPAKVQRNKQTGEMRIVANGQAFPYDPLQAEGRTDPIARNSAPDDAWSRVPGRALRAVSSGVANVADLIASPFRYGLNEVNEAFGGAPDYFKPLGQTLEQLYDRAGIAKAGNGLERLLDKAGEAVAGAAVPIGGALYAMRGASLAPSASQRMMGVLAEAPGIQAASSAASGGASELARQMGASPEIQMAVGLAGGIVPPVGAAAGQTAWRMGGGVKTALDAFTPAGRERIAGQTLNRVSSAAAAVRSRTREAYGAIDPEGTSDFDVSGLADKARAVLNKYYGPGGGTPHPELAAVRKELGELANERQWMKVGEITEDMARNLPKSASGDMRITPKGLEHIENNHGNQIRNLGFPDAETFVRWVNANQDAIYRGNTVNDIQSVVRQGTKAKKTVSALENDARGDYYRVKTAFPVSVWKTKNETPLWENTAANPSPITEASVNSGQSGIELNIPQYPPQSNSVPFQTLQNMRSRLAEVAHKAAMSGEGRAKAAAGEMSEAIDAMLENAAGEHFTPEQAARFKAAKQARTEQGERFERGANQIMGRRGNSLEGEASLMRTGQYAPREFLLNMLGRNSRAYANTAARQGLLSLIGRE